jgi:hypothetical protein
MAPGDAGAVVFAVAYCVSVGAIIIYLGTMDND